MKLEANNPPPASQPEPSKPDDDWRKNVGTGQPIPLPPDEELDAILDEKEDAA